MQIERTVIDHLNDRVEATGKITYTHPVTGQEVTEDYTVTLTESDALPKDGWTNDDEAVAVSKELTTRGMVENATVATVAVKVVSLESLAPPNEP
jgi:hypothetical protein